MLRCKVIKRGQFLRARSNSQQKCPLLCVSRCWGHFWGLKWYRDRLCFKGNNNTKIFGGPILISILTGLWRFNKWCWPIKKKHPKILLKNDQLMLVVFGPDVSPPSLCLIYSGIRKQWRSRRKTSTTLKHFLKKEEVF